MKKNFLITLLVLLLLVIAGENCYAGLSNDDTNVTPIFNDIYTKAILQGEVKEITYAGLQKLRESSEPFILVDVLTSKSYEEGHIQGAISFPADIIGRETVEVLLPKETNIVVYCAGFECRASFKAAIKLTKYGHKVLVYKGGLREWKEKGNRLVK